jgi:hypothetical protein
MHQIRAAFAAFSLLLLSPPVRADFGYHYVGLSQTAPVAHANRAVMTLHAKPQPCQWCHVMGWVVLWDADATGQWAEAGIGYSAWMSDGEKVSLWWASSEQDTGVAIDAVPFGTAVAVAMRKEDGEEEVRVVWSWRDGQGKQQVRVHAIPTPGWKTGPGIHPTKIEIYTDPENGAEHPQVAMEMSGIAQLPTDNAFLHGAAPYIVRQHDPGGENSGPLRSFYVEY